MKNKVTLICLCLLLMQAIFTMAISAEAAKSVDEKWHGGDDRSISEVPVQLYVDGSTLYIERVTFLSDINICIGTGSAVIYEGAMSIDEPSVGISLENVVVPGDEVWVTVSDEWGKYTCSFIWE